MKTFRPFYGSNIMRIVGLDISLNTTGIVAGIIENKKFIMKHKKVFTNIKSNYKKDKDTFILYKLPSKATQSEKMERLNFVVSYITKYINRVKPDYVAMEDYAFNAMGQVFDIGELIGNIKLFLFQKGIPFRTYAPTSLKMFIADNGNAKKPQMVSAVNRKFNIDFTEYIHENKGGTSKKFVGDSGFDLADAYSLCELLTTELLLRNGELALSDLGKKQVQVFNTVTKSNPINILARGFIENGQK